MRGPQNSRQRQRQQRHQRQRQQLQRKRQPPKDWGAEGDRNEEDDDIEEETKTLEGKCTEEISKKRLEKKKREKSFANTHKQEHEQENFEQDSVDVTTTPTPSRTQQNANFFYDDIPAVLLRNGAYETSKAIGLARLASTSTSTDRTNNIINDEQIAAANAYNVALACLGANNDLESALELLSRSDELRTYRFDQNYTGACIV